MGEDFQEEAGSRMAEQKTRSAHKRDWLEIIGKLGAPIAAIIAALAAALIANSFQRQMSGATLLSEREQAESKLRADMFASLITPIIGPQKDKNITCDKEQLLVELLALNFHEHFELKPLLERVDKRLREKGDEKSRRSLQSIVRRIIDRQIAVLQKETDDGSGMEGAEPHKFTVTEKIQKGNRIQEELFEMLNKEGNEAYQLEADETRRIISPDEKHMLTLRVMEPDWQNNKFKLEVFDAFSSASPGAHGWSSNKERRRMTEMNVSWADLPFTDNFLFDDGNRFAVVVYKVHPYCEGSEQPYYQKNEPHCPRGKPFKTAIIKFIWFPKNYYTPQERPIEHKELLKLVGKKPHWWDKLIHR